VDTGTVIIDFEKAVMNTFQSSLPGRDVSNSYFHLCQAVQKQIQKNFKVYYLFILYHSEKKFTRAARLVVFLTFVPIRAVMLRCSTR
jgi:predicted Ser/Thr protein kinase